MFSIVISAISFMCSTNARVNSHVITDDDFVFPDRTFCLFDSLFCSVRKHWAPCDNRATPPYRFKSFPSYMRSSDIFHKDHSTSYSNMTRLSMWTFLLCGKSYKVRIFKFSYILNMVKLLRTWQKLLWDAQNY